MLDFINDVKDFFVGAYEGYQNWSDVIALVAVAIIVLIILL